MPNSRPNVLWISTHDINPHLGCYAGSWPGAEQARTPRLDALAADGLRFDRAFSAAPVCGPSRSAIITGCFPPAIGTMHMRTRATPPPEVKLLPEYFRAAGYWTGNTAFTDFQLDVPDPVYDELGDHAHWRLRDDPEQPFFMAFHSLITHESQLYLSDEEFAAKTPDARRVEQVEVPPYHPDTEVYRKSWRRYLELISQLDHWAGGLLDQLDDDGIADNTIVVFWSDHGLGMPRGKRWATELGFREPLIMRWPAKIRAGSTYAEPVALMDLAPTMLALCGLEVPEHLHGEVIVDNAGQPGRVSPYVVGARDRIGEAEDTSRTVRDRHFRYTRHLHPDRSSMAHTEYPDNLWTWKELRRLFAQEARQQLAFGVAPSILTELQRSIVAAGKRAPEELYDVEADPHEELNLAGRPEYADVQQRLSDALDDWLDQVGDLGGRPEAELLAEWRPDGRRPCTETPEVEVRAGLVAVTCPTAGSIAGWSTRPPAASERDWQLYTDPFIPSGPIWIKSWRIGFEPSAEVRFTAP
ncbi:sulfatase family protein [Kribbella solani]|uniref:Putative sulfatase n=1 Tax=Kribbella solani TaxID=236067 RepID=A0A841DG57_9ACTN|nr:sulfatase [Kribbella solani]MBB5977513.1 putative sulfatase [Kribbella solani]